MPIYRQSFNVACIGVEERARSPAIVPAAMSRIVGVIIDAMIREGRVSGGRFPRPAALRAAATARGFRELQKIKRAEDQKALFLVPQTRRVAVAG